MIKKPRHPSALINLRAPQQHLESVRDTGRDAVVRAAQDRRLVVRVAAR
jgi:hypothetical protein